MCACQKFVSAVLSTQWHCSHSNSGIVFPSQAALRGSFLPPQHLACPLFAVPTPDIAMRTFVASLALASFHSAFTRHFCPANFYGIESLGPFGFNPFREHARKPTRSRYRWQRGLLSPQPRLERSKV